MVGLGMLRLALGGLGALAALVGKLFVWRPLHRFAVAMGPAGFVAVLAGWTTTEAGRQPFTIYGLLRTADSASPLAAPAVGASLIAFILVYGAVFAAGGLYVLKLMAHAPEPGEPGPERDLPLRSAGITPWPAMTEDAASTPSAAPETRS
jgi:cytochrome d ubiquinol oxidase subunit I